MNNYIERGHGFGRWLIRFGQNSGIGINEENAFIGIHWHIIRPNNAAWRWLTLDICLIPFLFIRLERKLHDLD